MAVIPCTSTPIVLGIVTFDASAFQAAYPEFAGLSVGQLNMAFALAQTILNNTCCSRVKDANLRDILLQMLTAHIAFIEYGTSPFVQALAPGVATLNITGEVNLLYGDAPPAHANFTPADPQSYNYASAPFPIYDALGVTYNAQVYWVATSNPLVQNVYLTIDGAPCAANVAGWTWTAEGGSVSVPASAITTFVPPFGSWRAPLTVTFTGSTLTAGAYAMLEAATADGSAGAVTNLPGTASQPQGIVGRISQATEGTVSVSAEFGGNGGPTQDWYLQSRYGALYWTATAGYRTAVYLAPPANPCGPLGVGFGYFGGGNGCGC